MKSFLPPDVILSEARQLLSDVTAHPWWVEMRLRCMLEDCQHANLKAQLIALGQQILPNMKPIDIRAAGYLEQTLRKASGAPPLVPT